MNFLLSDDVYNFILSSDGYSSVNNKDKTILVPTNWQWSKYKSMKMKDRVKELLYFKI